MISNSTGERASQRHLAHREYSESSLGLFMFPQLVPSFEGHRREVTKPSHGPAVLPDARFERGSRELVLHERFVALLGVQPTM